jgi:hypothetical protein
MTAHSRRAQRIVANYGWTLQKTMQRVSMCRKRGKHHSLAAMLALTCRAMLCGDRSYPASAEWGRNDGATLVPALGFTRPRPVLPPSIPCCTAEIGACWKPSEGHGLRAFCTSRPWPKGLR